MAQSCQVPRGVPPQSAYADSSPASGGAFWCTLQAYRLASLSREVGFALAKAGGVEKESRFAWYRQPLSQTFGLPAPRPGSLLDCASTNYKPALKGEVANEVSRRGYKETHISPFVSTPQLKGLPQKIRFTANFQLPQ